MSGRRGLDRSDPRVWIVAALIFVAILVVTIIILSTNGDEPIPPPAAEPTIAPTPTPTPTRSSEPPVEPSNVPPPVLASGQDEDFVFSVTNVERDVPFTIDDGRQAEGAFTLVTLTVENVGTEPLGFSTTDVGAIDPTGQLWKSDNLDESEVTVNPGSSIEKVIVFDIAVGVDLTAIQATGSSSGSIATADGVEIPLP